MEFENIVLIHRENGKFLREGLKIQIEECFENIKAFYEEDGKVYLILNLENDFEDEEFDFIIENFPYEDFENLNLEIYPKDHEYYPTFILEFKYECEEHTEIKIKDILRLFMEKVVKIHCNKF